MTHTRALVAFGSCLLAACGSPSPRPLPATEVQNVPRRFERHEAGHPISDPEVPPPARSRRVYIAWSAQAQEYVARDEHPTLDRGLCSEGQAQSPIDITGATRGRGQRLRASYSEADTTVRSTGLGIAVIAPEAGSITVGDAEWSLRLLEFHAPSEHSIDGERFPLEVQFAHPQQRRCLGGGRGALSGGARQPRARCRLGGRSRGMLPGRSRGAPSVRPLRAPAASLVLLHVLRLLHRAPV